MSTKDQMLKAQKLIKDGKYREARAILKKINHPKAKEWLAKIDEKDPPKKRGGGSGLLRDLAQVLLMALIFTALFAGVGVGASVVIGIPGVEVSALGAGGSEAPLPTAPPDVAALPTEPACDAQAWWDANAEAFADNINGVSGLSIQMRPADIQRVQADFQLWKNTLQVMQAPDCVAALKSAANAALPALDAYMAAHLTPTTDQERARLLLTVMDALLPLADAVQALNISSPADDWITPVQDFTRAECPADRWLIETMIARGYLRFFDLASQVDLQRKSVAEVNDLLRQISDIRSAWNTDSEKFPECTKSASGHLLNSMNAFINTINAVLNQDLAVAQAEQANTETELSAFMNEVGKLSPDMATLLRIPRR